MECVEDLPRERMDVTVICVLCFSQRHRGSWYVSIGTSHISWIAFFFHLASFKFRIKG